MPSDVHVHFRLTPAYGKKLKALADAHGTSPSLAARSVLIDVLDSSLREELLSRVAALEEEVAGLRAALGEELKELRDFRAEFQAALRRTTGG